MDDQYRKGQTKQFVVSSNIVCSNCGSKSLEYDYEYGGGDLCYFTFHMDFIHVHLKIMLCRISCLALSNFKISAIVILFQSRNFSCFESDKV